MVLMVAAAIPRFWQNGRESYWYDEVVTVKVARSSDVIGDLKRWDASRAPLHPLILHAWIVLLGDGEGRTRTLSALCGIGTVAMVFLIGRQIGGWGAGVWGMAFAAASPLLVEYDRETRMYSLLTLLTCLAWWNLLSFRQSTSWPRCMLQSVLLAFLAYAHPLGLLMIVGLGMGWLVDRARSRLDLGRWMAIQAVAALLILPWIGNYLDHPPEFVSDARALRFLIGMPIGFTGGTSRSLLIFLGLILGGGVSRSIPGLVRASEGSVWPIVAWFMVAPAMLFTYSQFGASLFGPARYNVFVAPAYFVLIGRGLSRLRLPMGLIVGGSLLGVLSLPSLDAVIQSRSKADWRAASDWLIVNAPGSHLIVVSPDTSDEREVLVARFYLRGLVEVSALNRAEPDRQLIALKSEKAFYSVSLRGEKVIGDLPPLLLKHSTSRDVRTIQYRNFSGTLRLIELSVTYR